MKKKAIWTIISSAALLLTGFKILYDTNHFEVTTYRLKSKKIKKPYRFAVLADLHDKQFGKNNQRLLEEIDRLNPEAVYIAGDMVTGHPGKQHKHTLIFLRQLAKKYPVYYGSGNHEYRMRIYPDKFGTASGQYEKALKDAGITRLYTGFCDTGRSDVRVYGIEIDKVFYKKYNMPRMPRDYSVQKIGRTEQNCFTILLAHDPVFFANYARTGADLVLSGHIHGGIVRLPVLGGVISPRLKLFPHYDGGMYHERNSVMLLSRGLSTHTIPVRLFNPGELLYVEIEPE